MRRTALLTALAVALLGSIAGAPAAATAPTAASGIHQIRHVVVIMQENRSFDGYFGTYPGADRDPDAPRCADRLPARPLRHTCVRPYHDPHLVNYGGPHDAAAYTADCPTGG